MMNSTQKRWDRIKVILTGVLVIFYFFFPLSLLGLGETISGWIRNLSILTMLAMYFHQLPQFFRGKYASVRIALFAFCVIQVLSVIVNINFISSLDFEVVIQGESIDVNGMTTPKFAIYKSIMLLVFALSLEKISNKGYAVLLIKTMTIAIALLVAVSNVNAFLLADFSEGGGYLVGDKFMVCYLNLFLCTLYYYLYPKLQGYKKIVMFSLVVMMMAMSIRTECTTMLVGGLVFSIFVLVVPKSSAKTLTKSSTLLISLLVFDVLFFLFVGWLLKIPTVQKIVVDYLNEDLTLTGRLSIYEEIRTALVQRPLLGFGEGNSFIVSEFFADAPDAQNGLVDVFIRTGILGCVAFVSLLLVAFKTIRKNAKEYFPIISLIYSMIVVSMVEIPFNDIFIFFIVLLCLQRPITYKWVKLPPTVQ